MTDKKEPIEAELVKREIGPQAVMQTPKQLQAQMERDVKIRKIINDYIAANMVAGKDYGSIEVKKNSGIMSKPSLFKPGAEKFCGLFKIRPTFRKDSETIEMLGNTPGIIAYVCELVDGQGRVVGEGRGTAKTDPINGLDFDINKQVKIAQKRAQIDAVLRTGGLSDFFTQDMEDAPKDFNSGSESQSRLATVKQKNLISKLFLERGANTPNLLLASIEANGISNAKEMTAKEASDLIEKLFANSATVVTKLEHTHGSPDNESEHLDDIVGRGDGDPDVHGYPGEEDQVVDGDMSDEAIAKGLEEAEANLLGEDQTNE